MIKPHSHCKYLANIAKITFKGQNPPDSVYIGGTLCKVKPFIPIPISAKTAGDSDIQKNTVDPPHVALSAPHLAIPVQTALQQYKSMQTAPKNIMFYSRLSSLQI